MYFWTIGNFCNILFSLHSLKRVKSEKEILESRIAKDESKKEVYSTKLKTLIAEKKVKTRLLLKALGDFVTSTTGAGLI